MPLKDWVEGTPDYKRHRELIDYLIEAAGYATGVKRWWLPVPNSQIIAAPLTENWGIVGMAFDYAMRMRLVQINEMAPVELSEGGDLIATRGVKGGKRRQVFIDDFWHKWFEGYTVTELLPDCIILANLETVFRSGIDPGNDDIFHVDKKDVEDLQNLVNLIDGDTWRERIEESSRLNPCFGKSSSAVGGGDADVIIDGKLIDIKTVKALEARKEIIRQVFGYYLLNLREGNPDKIHTLGIYFSRHGVLHTFPIPVWPDDPDNQLKDNKGRLILHGWYDAGIGNEVWESIEDSIAEYMGLCDDEEDDDDDDEGDDDPLRVQERHLRYCLHHVGV